jgi:hypothetical protein
VMFLAGLILFQRIPIAMEAQQGKLITFASLDWVCDGWTAHKKPVVEYAGEVFELFEMFDEGGFVRFCY